MASEARPTLRETRERELVAATRALFDERGMQDAPVEEIARSVGIARGLIYRQFSSKEELFVLTVTDYLAELADRLEAAAGGAAGPPARLESVAREFLDFCTAYPAFLDCALSLTRRPPPRLREDVSESVWLRLGAGMASCIGPLSAVLAEGAADGDFDVADPDVAANVMWAQSVGAMHLARIGVGVRRTDGAPALFAIGGERLRATLLDAAFAQVGATRPPPPAQAGDGRRRGRSGAPA